MKTLLEIARNNIDTIYNKDIAKKQQRRNFIDASFENKSEPFTGIAAFMMYNGTCLTGPGGLYGITNDWDYAPGTVLYPGRKICYAICDKIVSLNIPINHFAWVPYQTKYYSKLRINADFLDIESSNLHEDEEFLTEMSKEVQDIFKRYPKAYWSGMYMEHRIRKPNVCFPNKPQTQYDYIKICHFMRYV